MKNYGKIEHSLDGTTKEWVESLFGTVSDPEDGITPHIGANGNWYIGEDDTGVAAQGEPGEPGEPGEKGDSITITESVTTGDGDIQLTFSDGSVVIIPRGLPGEDGEDGGAGEVVEYDFPITISASRGSHSSSSIFAKRVGDSVFIKGMVRPTELFQGTDPHYVGSASVFLCMDDYGNITGNYPEFNDVEVLGVSTQTSDYNALRNPQVYNKIQAGVDAGIITTTDITNRAQTSLVVRVTSETINRNIEFFAEIKFKLNE